MLVPKKNIEQFYTELMSQFPQLKELSIWQECDWSEQGYENSRIMTAIAQEMANWAANNQLQQTQLLLDFIESSFFDFDNRVTSFIYTDFLVTFMEIKDKETREMLKKQMKSETAKHYQQLFKFYREAP
jgi:predicted XRE-type DNA-binding protein